MKTKTMLTIAGLVCVPSLMYAQQDSEIVNIPDENFKRALLNQPSININGDEEISYEEARATLKINVYGKEISSLKGIEAFINLRELYCSRNNLTKLDLSKNINLEELYCSNNQLEILEIEKNTELKNLICYSNQLKRLDVSENSKLQELDVSHNKLSSINIKESLSLKKLNVSYNALTRLDIKNNHQLEELSVANNLLPSLNIVQNSNLLKLDASDNYFTGIDLSGNLLLEDLKIDNNDLNNINVSLNKKLKKLDCSKNRLKNIDVSENILLEKLTCSTNRLESLDLSKNTNLQELICTENYWDLKQLNLANGNNENLSLVDIKDNLNLMCIQIDKDFIPDWKWEKEDTASYSSDCKYPTLSVDIIKNSNNIEVITLAENTLTIIGDKSIKKIELYSGTGQLLKVLLRNNRNISDISTGVYLLKIYTEKGIKTKKIIKR